MSRHRLAGASRRNVFVCFSLALAGTVIACSATVEPLPMPAPAPSPTTTSTTQPSDPKPAPTSTSTSTPDAAPPPDAGKDSGNERSIQGSAECKLFCDTLATECPGQTCGPTKCDVPTGHCAASYKAYLKCQAETGSWSCGSGGYSIIHSCRKDTSLCN